jgi:hypothetical protein
MINALVTVLAVVLVVAAWVALIGYIAAVIKDRRLYGRREH